MKDILSKDLDGIIPHLLIPVGIGRKPAQSKRSSKEDVESLKIGIGKGNQITRWQKVEEENEGHLFYDCSYTQEAWGHLKQWWSSLPIAPDNIQLLRYLKNYKGSSTLKQVTSAVIIGIFYHIWSARNHRIFKNQQITASQTANLIKDQVRSRILFLNTCSKKYSRYIDRLLSLVYI
ncbi:hypothetical protein Cgig2_023792 [Carnegiea gigantea]|uniref:Uncharacterized protein n=1 Tax=Carnegiea gigantea TaxID=171969 RepID=A0A9Q1Q5Y6_9CARY|nr:hypothetical protein Cgig2_023792 [Carnegiea gigantea]